MSAFLAVWLRELWFMRRRYKKILAGAAVNPLLYMIAFGSAFDSAAGVDGHRYLEFLVPGLAAMASMTQAFAIGVEISISRFYSYVFEEVQASPATRGAYVFGEMCAGLTRALLACGVILCLGLLFGVRLRYGVFFWTGIIFNALTFSGLAAGLAMLVRSHADQALLNSFVITPMAFLGGTFFPVERLPEWAGSVLRLLPLTHASAVIRAGAYGQEPPLLSLALLPVFSLALFLFALRTVSRARE